jgi:hypothetical protein
MTTQDLSTGGVTTKWSIEIEKTLELMDEELTTLEARIVDLKASKAVMLNMLKALQAGESPVPEPRSERPVLPLQETVATAQSPVVQAPAKPKRSRTRAAATAATGTRTRAHSAAAKKPTAHTPQTKAAELSVAQRVTAFLQAHPGPQSAAEIAHDFYGPNATQAEINRVRTAAANLTTRGTIERFHQGKSVYFQATSAPAATTSEAADESTVPA